MKEDQEALFHEDSYSDIPDAEYATSCVRYYSTVRWRFYEQLIHRGWTVSEAQKICDTLWIRTLVACLKFKVALPPVAQLAAERLGMLNGLSDGGSPAERNERSIHSRETKRRNVRNKRRS